MSIAEETRRVSVTALKDFGVQVLDKVDVPEADYARLRTVDDVVRYAEERMR